MKKRRIAMAAALLGPAAPVPVRIGHRGPGDPSLNEGGDTLQPVINHGDEYRVVSGVLEGRGDWLFLHAGAHKQFSYLTGELAPQPESVAAFVDNIASRADYCAERGIPYLHLLSPAKPTVMREHLPGDLGNRIESIYQRHYRPELVRRGADAAVFYPIEELRSIADDRGPYRVRDTHIGDPGNLYLTELVLERLGVEAASLRRSFSESVRPRQADLAVMLGSTGGIQEPVLEHEGGAHVADNMRNLSGNTGHVRISRNPAAPDERRLLIFGDSFLHGMLKFFAAHFREVTFLRSSSLQRDIAEAVAPDLIITGNTERYLARVTPDALDSGFLSRLFLRRSSDFTPDFVTALAAQWGRRHHAAEWEAWARRVDAEVSRALPARLSPRRAVRELSVSDLGSTWAAGDADPQLTVDVGASVDSAELHAFVRVPGDTRLVVYADRAGESPKPLRAVRLNAGWNTVRLDLELHGASRVRLDPMARPGVFVIEQFAVRRVELPAGETLRDTKVR